MNAPALADWRRSAPQKWELFDVLKSNGSVALLNIARALTHLIFLGNSAVRARSTLRAREKEREREREKERKRWSGRERDGEIERELER